MKLGHTVGCAILTMTLFLLLTANAMGWPPVVLPPADAKPLPPASQLRARAIASYRESAQQRERYFCRETIENRELDGKGRVKKTSTVEQEIFYVNGFEISQPVTEGGQPLSGEQLKRRDERVKQAITDASQHRKPKDEGLVISAGDVLAQAKLTNERRTVVEDRPTIVVDVESDPQGVAHTLEQKLLRAMDGTIAIDEASGSLEELNLHMVSDVKIGGGLVANVHKGAHLHMKVVRQTDGVWLLALAEGTGDARVGLFFSTNVEFRQQTTGCRLLSVSSASTVLTHR